MHGTGSGIRSVRGTERRPTAPGFLAGAKLDVTNLNANVSTESETTQEGRGTL